MFSIPEAGNGNKNANKGKHVSALKRLNMMD
jgi:hypothetical protein